MKRLPPGENGSANFLNVTLTSADPALLLCWEKRVKQGVECFLLLKHRRVKIPTILQCNTLKSSEAKTKTTTITPPAEVKKPKKREDAGGPNFLPPTPGGGKGSTTQQADAAACFCCTTDYSYPEARAGGNQQAC